MNYLMKMIKNFFSVITKIFKTIKTFITKTHFYNLYCQKRQFYKNYTASSIGFIVGMLVIGLVVASLVGTFAYQITQAQANTSVAGIPGGSAMLGILALLFIIIPVIIFARAAK